MKKRDAIIGGVSLLILLIGALVFISLQSGDSDYRTMQGPVAIVAPGANPTTQSIERLAPPPVALGAAIEGAADGVLVKELLPGGPADLAGLQRGDVILAIDDARTLTPQRLMDTLRQHKVDDEVTIKIRRGEKQQELKVKLMARTRMGR